MVLAAHGNSCPETPAALTALTAAVDALRQDKPVPKRAGQGAGGACPIAFPERARRNTHAAISYPRTIAPPLIEKCIGCHRPGGIGPFALSSYTMVYGFAPMIREVLRTGRMPPWLPRSS